MSDNNQREGANHSPADDTGTPQPDAGSSETTGHSSPDESVSDSGTDEHSHPRNRTDGEQSAAQDPANDRRRFLQAIGVAGVGGAAYYFGFAGSGSDHSAGSFDSDLPGDPAPANDHEHMPAEYRNNVLPAEQAATEYDVTYSEETTVIAGAEIDAIIDADLDTHQYTFDEEALDRDLSEGDILIISGVSLRRVAATSRSEGTLVVETDQATLPEAIESGTIAWESEFRYDEAFSQEEPADAEQQVDALGSFPVGGTAGSGRIAGLGLSGAGQSPTRLSNLSVGSDVPTPTPPSQIRRQHSLSAAESDDETEPEDVEDPDDIQLEDPQLSWSVAGEYVRYTFELSATGEGASVLAHTQFPPDDPYGAFSVRGSIGNLQCDCHAEFEDNELTEMDLDEDIGAELEVKSAHAATGFLSMDTEIPWPVFTWVIFVGPIPITFRIRIQFAAEIDVPARGSATFDGLISYGGTTGFTFDNGGFDTRANVGGLQLQMTDDSNATARIGEVVNAQFGLGFPKLQIGVAGDLVVPYVMPIHLFGSTLTWPEDEIGNQEHFTGFELDTGYNFSVFGIDIGSREETLFEDYEYYRHD